MVQIFMIVYFTFLYFKTKVFFLYQHIWNSDSEWLRNRCRAINWRKFDIVCQCWRGVMIFVGNEVRSAIQQACTNNVTRIKCPWNILRQMSGAADEIMFVAQKSPLHRKCLKDRHPSANSNIDEAPSLYAENKVIKILHLFRILESVAKRYFYARTMEMFSTQLICLKTNLKNWVKFSCIIIYCKISIDDFVEYS